MGALTAKLTPKKRVDAASQASGNDPASGSASLRLDFGRSDTVVHELLPAVPRNVGEVASGWVWTSSEELFL